MHLDGIVGRIVSSTCDISNCSNVGDITAQLNNAGGIVGAINDNSIVTIEKVYNTASITTNMNNDTGGIIGIVQNSSVVRIGQTYNTGSIYAKNEVSGGIVGSSYTSSEVTIENCYNIGVINCGIRRHGGILGDINNATGTINYCHNYGTLSGSETYKGGIVGYQNGTYSGIANYWLSTCGATYGIGKTNTDNNATKYSTEQMKIQSNFIGWDFDKIWKMDETKGYPVLKNLPNIIK